MIVDTMTAKEVRREYERDLVELQPIVESCIGRLWKKFIRSGKVHFQYASRYTINRNVYVVNYVLTKQEARAALWHYVTNSKQPYFLASLQIGQKEDYYAIVDAHAILRYMQRTPDYVPDNKLVFAKEAMNVASDMTYFSTVNENLITPSGLWPLANKEIADGFLHVKTFIHKSMLTKRQTEIYKLGLQGIPAESIPLFAESLREFGVSL